MRIRVNKWLRSILGKVKVPSSSPEELARSSGQLARKWRGRIQQFHDTNVRGESDKYW